VQKRDKEGFSLVLHRIFAYRDLSQQYGAKSLPYKKGASMRESAFRQFLPQKGLGSLDGWVAYVRKIERAYGVDLDTEFQNDQIQNIEQRARTQRLKQACVIPHYRDFCLSNPPLTSASAQKTPPISPVAPPIGGAHSTQSLNPGNPVPYWNAQNLDLNDCLNQQIWAFQASCLYGQQPQSVGAQQGMLEHMHGQVICNNPSSYPAARICSHPVSQANVPPCCCLPWVPDMVGKNWKEDEAILVFGSAYAGFIQNYSQAGIKVLDYAGASSVADFQSRLFLPNVVNGMWGNNNGHYSKIASLLQGSGYKTPEKVLVGDLCRASFVKRQTGQSGTRSDKADDAVINDNCALFTDYLIINNPWTSDRIKSSSARRIIALGSIAEHGLIRLFIQMGAQTIATNRGAIFNIQKYQQWMLSSKAQNWSKKYATDGAWAPKVLNLGYWVNQNRPGFWIITLGNREWHLLPVYHPSSRSNRFSINLPYYQQIIPKM
jgi:hypothetical protein